MKTGEEIDSMTDECVLSPLTCGDIGTSGLCLKEWQKGDSYHPNCDKVLKYTIKFAKINSVTIEVEAKSEEDAYDNAFTTWMASIEPEMEIVKVE
jgi:hypothetical protein